MEAHKLRIRSKTAFRYNQIVQQHIIPALGNIKLKDLRPDQIQWMYSEKLKEGKSERTVLMIHAVLHRAFEQAMKWGLIWRNPVDAVTRPRFKRKEMKIYTDDQVRVLLSFVKGTRTEALYWMAVSNGLRQGEMLGLKWSDIDWRNHRIHVQRQVQRTAQEGLVFSEPKSAAGNRTIVLDKMMLEILRAHTEL
jgi:integrase